MNIKKLLGIKTEEERKQEYEKDMKLWCFARRCINPDTNEYYKSDLTPIIGYQAQIPGIRVNKLKIKGLKTTETENLPYEYVVNKLVDEIEKLRKENNRLGYADALDSTPGKVGGSGDGKASPQEQEQEKEYKEFQNERLCYDRCVEDNGSIRWHRINADGKIIYLSPKEMEEIIDIQI